uniref:Uncharacterized protein n=1 Tax=Heliothis virescens TaxID=7102 RepID=A0A2A4JUX9_HELVI
MNRTPPKPLKTPGPGISQSVPDIASGSKYEESYVNVSRRGQRPRIDDSPSKLAVDSSCTCWEWKSELMQLLTTWRTEYEQKLSLWKAGHDAMLSALVKEVSEIKNQCVAIHKATIGLEAKSASHQLRAKGRNQEKSHDEMQPVSMVPTTSQLSNAPPPNLDAGKVGDPTAIVPKRGKAMNRYIAESNPRNINPPSKPVASDTCKASINSVSLPPPAAAADVTLSDTDKDGQSKDGWTEVRYRRSHRSLSNILRGTAAPGTTNLEASERWRYLHLFYVKQGTSEGQVRDHLITICGSDVCTVDVLKPRGKYASFKLGVPSKLAELVMAPQSWAEDICVKPWRRNFRGQSNDPQ